MNHAAQSPLLIASAPNGARKTRDDHRALPITVAQIADTAGAVHDAGARMLHLHVRDANGKHTLDADAYRAAIAAVRARVGDDMFIQITSEAAGVYTAAQQREAIGALRDDDVDGVSIALREWLRDDDDYAPSVEAFEQLAHRGILIQYILYGEDDIARYASLLRARAIPHNLHSLLLVVGRFGHQESTPQALHAMITALSQSETTVQWMACAFGAHEFDCLVAAAESGGHVRVGFENSLRLKDGEAAADNRQLIAQWSAPDRPDRPSARPLADIHQARTILGADG